MRGYMYRGQTQWRVEAGHRATEEDSPQRGSKKRMVGLGTMTGTRKDWLHVTFLESAERGLKTISREGVDRWVIQLPCMYLRAVLLAELGQSLSVSLRILCLCL